MIILEYIAKFFLAVIIEGFIVDGLFKAMRYIGAYTLYLAGCIKKMLFTDAKTYSFKQIWTMDYDKNDEVLMLAEHTGQTILGAFVAGGFIWFLFEIF